MNNIKIEKTDEKLSINVPYNKEFLEEFKNCIGTRTWNNNTKSWICNVSDEKIIRNLILKYFGYDEKCNTTKEIYIEALNYMSNELDSIYFCGIPIARAYGRDSGAKVCENVTLIDGDIGSCGSRIHWDTYVQKGSTFKVIVAETFNLSDANWKIINNSSITKDNLLKEKETLLKRLEEIEKELKTIGE